MSTLRMTTCAGFLALAQTAVLVAQEPAPPDRPLPPPGRRPTVALVQALDVDGDGAISKEEIEGAVAALKSLDKNEDGALTREEYIGQMVGPPGGFGPPPEQSEQFVRALLASADKDGDERISKEEAIGPLRENFDAVDANKDGQIDRAELVAMQRRLGGGRPPGDPAEMMLSRIMEADRDGDGKVSKEEAPDRLKENFDNLDGNKDGVLDREELLSLARTLGGRRTPPEIAQEMASRALVSSDKDNDGKLSKEEAPEHLKGMFEAIDANKDGLLDKEEIVARISALGSVRPGGLPPPPERPEEGRPRRALEAKAEPGEKPASDDKPATEEKPAPEKE